jgi:hypothetical protein
MGAGGTPSSSTSKLVKVADRDVTMFWAAAVDDGGLVAGVVVDRP